MCSKIRLLDLYRGISYGKLLHGLTIYTFHLTIRFLVNHMTNCMRFVFRNAETWGFV